LKNRFKLRLKGVRIYLVGFMGAGKTAVGQLLADRLDFGFVDLDEVLVEKLGMSIRECFDRFGEQRFRATEHQALVETSELERIVIATGGGAFCSQPNRDVMHSNGGRSVFLDIPWPALADRLGGDQTARPVLRTLDEAERLYQERRAHYRQATVTVPLTGLEPPVEVAAMIQTLVSPEVPCGT